MPEDELQELSNKDKLKNVIEVLESTTNREDRVDLLLQANLYAMLHLSDVIQNVLNPKEGLKSLAAAAGSGLSLPRRGRR